MAANKWIPRVSDCHSVEMHNSPHQLTTGISPSHEAADSLTSVTCFIAVFATRTEFLDALGRLEHLDEHGAGHGSAGMNLDLGRSTAMASASTGVSPSNGASLKVKTVPLPREAAPHPRPKNLPTALLSLSAQVPEVPGQNRPPTQAFSRLRSPSSFERLIRGNSVQHQQSNLEEL